MPVYNDSGFLRCSVKSILNQEFSEFEFLIIDDGSTDNTEEVIQEFKDSRINYKKIPHKGLAGALNYGLSEASGDFIARIDADDLNTSQRLRIQLDAFNRNPELDVISSRSVYFNGKYKILFFIDPPEKDSEIKSFLNLHNPINHSAVIFRKKKITENRGYNETFNCYEDFELWFRLRDKLTFHVIPEYLVYTRLRRDSLTARENKTKIHKLLFDNAFKEYNKSNDEKGKEYWNNILFWIEYFYGDKIRARKYAGKKMTYKKLLAFLNTYLPEKAFMNVAGLRIRQRIQSKLINQKKFKSELKSLARN